MTLFCIHCDKAIIPMGDAYWHVATGSEFCATKGLFDLDKRQQARPDLSLIETPNDLRYLASQAT